MADILPTISKPSRYTGNELNVIRKNQNRSNMVMPTIRIALAFPDIYDVGMSHLGLKILYNILNSRDDIWAERAFAPWIDMEEYIRAEGKLLSSLESSTPLIDFDIIGFSLQYEMSYTSVLNMLNLAQIPLLSKDRTDNHPLIMAGGPCVFNPEPIADFIDFFVIGDGEEIVLEIIDCYKNNKELEKRQLLGRISQIEGIYVPALVSLKELPNGTLVVSDSKKIKKRVVADLDDVPYPVDYIVPFMKPIHDRAIVEIMRGCSRGCRFCQAGMIYRPVRERSSKVIKKLANEIIEKTGYEELSLSSLSTCDHSSIYEIVAELVGSLGKEKHVAISLPSLRTDAFSLELARKLGSIGKTGLTFAPEVATDKLRNVINKGITKEDILSTIEDAFSTGWDTLKLYFMIGLPTETEDDISGIANLIREILNVARKANNRAKISVSVSTFVPKAHTPFQWERQVSIEEIKDKQKLLLSKIGRNSRIDISFHSPEVSFLEGVFARGDRRLSKVLLKAHQLGCRLDGWSELFDFNKWMEAFAMGDIDPSSYHRSRASDEILPWDHIDSRISKEFLLTERDRAYKGEMTPDCRNGECSDCGICDEKIKVKLDSGQKIKDTIENYQESNIQNSVSKIRFHFIKGDEVKYISHLDLINVFTRAFRRAEIPISYSHGFNPHPKINFASAVPLGSTSNAEYSDIELDEDIDPQDFISLVNEQLPFGVKILRAKRVPLKSTSLMAQTGFASYVVRIPNHDCSLDDILKNKIQSIMANESILINRQQKPKKFNNQNTGKTNLVDVKSLVKNIELLGCIDNVLEISMLLGDGSSGKVRPEEIIILLFSDDIKADEDDIKFSSLDIIKTDYFIECQGQFFSPMEIQD
ncbi:TPA: TIGR03960 family B12-binding radical SAM protein [bacterium]|nr:TIGR03960 family B12-binding radical SAM protein [bacterium]